MIIISVITSSIIYTLDSTIAVVALPHMQSALMASPDQVIWVLTSYLVASAVMMPLSGWLANRYGRKRVMNISIAVFTLSSVACGLSQSLEFMVFARLIQGIAGSGLLPLGQATLMDINPPEKQGQAMALGGAGAMIGPLLGPSLGGWLTDNFSWRWVFLINLPIGIFALLLAVASHIEIRGKDVGKFDFFGFAAVATFIGALQLLMDRGQINDWFDSTETWIECALMLLGLYLTIVHMLTRRNTFVKGEMFLDRNYALGCLLSLSVGMVIFAGAPTVTFLTQDLLGYTPYQNGVINVPRAIGSAAMILLVNRIIVKVEPRLLMSVGLGLTVLALYFMAGLSLQVERGHLLIGSLLWGLSSGLLVVPLSILSFSTLDSRFRNEATALHSLARTLGNSVGISILQVLTVRQSAQVAGRLSEGVRPDSPSFQFARPDNDLDSATSLLTIDHEVWRHAAMVAVTDVFWLTCVMAAASIPFILLMKVKPVAR